MQPRTLFFAVVAGFQFPGALAQSANSQTMETGDTDATSANATASITADSIPAKMAPEVADQLASISEALDDMQEEIESAEDSLELLGFSVDKAASDELSDELVSADYRPMPKQPRSGALELWSQRGFHGHRVLYGAKEDQCDTVETYTYSRTGYGKSARVVEEGVCCHLFTAPGCNGHSVVVSGDVPALRPYDMDNKVKSIMCCDCNKLYADSDY